jgi:uncharacterized protein YcsI (UPF0317 family)
MPSASEASPSVISMRPLRQKDAFKATEERVSFPNVSIGNPLHFVIPDLIGNPEDSKDMDPHFHGDDRKGHGDNKKGYGDDREKARE